MGAVTRFLEFALEKGLIKESDKGLETIAESLIKDDLAGAAKGESAAILKILKTLEDGGAKLGPLGDRLLNHNLTEDGQKRLVDALLLTSDGQKFVQNLTEDLKAGVTGGPRGPNQPPNTGTPLTAAQLAQMYPGVDETQARIVQRMMETPFVQGMTESPQVLAQRQYATFLSENKAAAAAAPSTIGAMDLIPNMVAARTGAKASQFTPMAKGLAALGGIGLLAFGIKEGAEAYNAPTTYTAQANAATADATQKKILATGLAFNPNAVADASASPEQKAQRANAACLRSEHAKLVKTMGADFSEDAVAASCAKIAPLPGPTH